MSKWRIIVPGSTANLGPGFDSIGLGLALYLTLDVTLQDQWEIIHLDQNGPTDVILEEHLIYQIATRTAQQYGHELPACRIEMASELPLARGLGSSAAAIVAGIEVANQLCNLQLALQDKLNLSSAIEGHPDNATASVLGGLTISSMPTTQTTDTIHLTDINAAFVIYIPNFELKTADARAVLPNKLDRTYSVEASAHANMLAASLLIKDYERAGYYMESDLLHEPFRAQLIPHFTALKEYAKQSGAYGTALSGAGPTMISLVPHTIAESFTTQMQQAFPELRVILTKADEHGIRVNQQ